MANTCYLNADNVCFNLQGMQTNNVSLKDRIHAKRVELNLSQQQLAERAHVSQVTIQHLESGRNATSKRLVDIAKALGVSAEWLTSGKEAPQQSESDSSNLRMIAQPNQIFRYPVISWVAAGAWAEAVEPYPSGFADRYEMSDYDSKGPAFWLEVKGDSMTSPVGVSVPEGMLILVDPDIEVEPGKMVVVRTPGAESAMFRQLIEDSGQRYLKPLNPTYPKVLFDEGCRVLGVVVQATTKF